MSRPETGSTYGSVFTVPAAPRSPPDGVEVGFHPADHEKNPRGGSTVVYWRTDDLDEERERLIASGCTPWRGPLDVDDRRRICQLTDPFGIVFGLDSGD